MGEESVDDGQISIDRNVTIGHFSQDVGEMKGMPALAATMDGAGPVSELAKELHELEHAMADPARADELDKLVDRFGHVQARFDELGGYALEARAVFRKSRWTVTWATCRVGGRCAWPWRVSC
jgi:ATPase subunit of ABC transporter with duplicated ATPase domains